MKRFIGGALFVVLALAAFASVASAARLTMLPVKWRNQNASNIGSPSGTGRDTIWKQIKVGATDTTATITTNGWSFPDFRPVADTTIVANLFVATDSTAAGSFTATSFTITPQYGTGDDNQWTSGAAITFTDVTANDQCFKFPIYMGKVTRGLIGTAGWPTPAMRFLIVAIGGVVSPARAWVQFLSE